MAIDAEATVGAWLDADIYLGIDPFFYFEELHARPKMPKLQSGWRIKSIVLETIPWLSTKNENGGNTLTRNGSKRTFKEVAETHAWDDDEGRGEYVLECERIA